MRIVAFTLDPSLGAALNMLDEAEIISAGGIDGVVESARGSAIVLIGVGSIVEGVDVAQQIYSRGVTIPSLVVGDGLRPESSTVPVLIRPFSLDDLRNAIDSAVKDAPVAPPAAPPTSAEAPEGAYAPPGDPDGVRNDEGEDAVVVELRPQARPSEPAEEPLELTSADSSETQVEDVEGPEGGEATTLQNEPEVSPEPQPVAAVPAALATPTPPAAQTAVVPGVRGVAPSTDRELLRRLGLHKKTIPESSVPAAYEQPRRRRGLTRKEQMPAAPAEAPTASPLVERLRTGLAAMTDIRKLLEELPTVADVVEMAEALLAEVGFAFSPQIASVYIREGNIFRIVASRGLSRVEQNLEISEEHQLFSQVLLSSEPILIAPVDLARGLVAGIGGAHTEAMMVGPIHADGECIGALVLGRPDFTDSDLDVLANLAREAGPGLAFARALRALRDWPL